MQRIQTVIVHELLVKDYSYIKYCCCVSRVDTHFKTILLFVSFTFSPYASAEGIAINLFPPFFMPITPCSHPLHRQKKHYLVPLSSMSFQKDRYL